MPVVSASIRRDDSRLMITLTPLRVLKPCLPVVTGMTRSTFPFRRTVSVCLLMSTVLIIAEPTWNDVVRVPLPHTPGATSTLRSADVTVTLVPVFQYCFGRHWTCDEENQRQPPSVDGVAVTVSPLSAAARSFTGLE